MFFVSVPLFISCLLSVLCVSVVNFNLLRFALPQTQPIAAKFEFKRVAERRRAEAANLDAGRNAHFQQPPADIVRADNSNDSARLADSKLGRDERHADFLESTINRSESSSRKQSVLPSTRRMHGEPQRTICKTCAGAQAQALRAGEREPTGPTTSPISATWPGRSAEREMNSRMAINRNAVENDSQYNLSADSNECSTNRFNWQREKQ